MWWARSLPVSRRPHQSLSPCAHLPHLVMWPHGHLHSLLDHPEGLVPSASRWHWKPVDLILQGPPPPGQGICASPDGLAQCIPLHRAHVRAHTHTQITERGVQPSEGLLSLLGAGGCLASLFQLLLRLQHPTLLMS